jgi:hypothetical protein
VCRCPRLSTNLWGTAGSSVNANIAVESFGDASPGLQVMTGLQSYHHSFLAWDRIRSSHYTHPPPAINVGAWCSETMESDSPRLPGCTEAAVSMDIFSVYVEAASPVISRSRAHATMSSADARSAGVAAHNADTRPTLSMACCSAP